MKQVASTIFFMLVIITIIFAVFDISYMKENDGRFELIEKIDTNRGYFKDKEKNICFYFSVEWFITFSQSTAYVPCELLK